MTHDMSIGSKNDDGALVDLFVASWKPATFIVFECSACKGQQCVRCGYFSFVRHAAIIPRVTASADVSPSHCI
jgi:hypothetical protein